MQNKHERKIAERKKRTEKNDKTKQIRRKQI